MALPAEGVMVLKEESRLPGPGSIRVGRWIGRLGVVSVPAAQIGLGLDERVVRRHVARLERAGWLGRGAGIWGEGSVVWLTAPGFVGLGLGGLQPVRANPEPSPTLIAHSVQVGWSAARLERRGLKWMSARELAVERERWAIPARAERGWRTVLPDLVVWPAGSQKAAAIVVEAGYRRRDRQKAILEAWRDAISSGRYVAVRYDCVGESTARQIGRQAEKIGLNGSRFHAAAQMTTEQIAAIPPTPPPADESVGSGSGAAGAQVVAPREQERSEHKVELVEVPPEPEPEPELKQHIEPPEA